MRWNTFTGSLLFAAAAAAAYFPYALLAGPFIGHGFALVSYLAGTVALYLAGSCSSWRLGARLGLLAGGLGFAVLVLSPALHLSVFALALILAVGRGALAYRTAVARALAIELALGAGGLALAAFLFGNGLVSVGLAIWGYYLVQSVFFLVGGKRERGLHPTGPDAYETARARAVAIMEEAGG